MQRILRSVQDETDADYKEALSTDRGLDASKYTDKAYFKCFPKADAEDLVSISGNIDSIGVTADYKIIYQQSTTIPLGEDDSNTNTIIIIITAVAVVIIVAVSFYILKS